MSNLFLKTKIIEEEPTVHKHLYKKGSLQKIKNKLLDYINHKTCVVTIGHNRNPLEILIQQGDVAGYVVDFKIENGYGILEIEPELKFLHGQLLCNYINSGMDLRVDFRLQCTLSDVPDENGNYCVCMDDFGVENTLAVINNESKN